MELQKSDILEIKRNQELILKLLLPKKYTPSSVAKLANRTPQAVRLWLDVNCEPDVDFKKKGGKIVISEDVALQYINERR